ncbi:hypothetical protein CHARACLAT_003122 [Characodon lateralis]|uniref:Uncharacterized protein n=1 Tax=Characodon lateralis TaxID=208331 RepID=A0ABU7DFI4_9TELE|nr:hypothetical protein [Characodon lateralis]
MRHTVVILRTLSHGLNPCDNEQKSPAGVAVAPSPELIAQAAEVSSNQRISATADSDAIFVANINNIGESRRHLAVRLLFHGTRPKSSHRGAHAFRRKCLPPWSPETLTEMEILCGFPHREGAEV